MMQLNMSAGVASPWLRRFGPVSQDAVVRLVLLHHAGGSASFFRGWVPLIPDYVDVVAVQLPGRENRRRGAPYTQRHKLSEPLAAALDTSPGLPTHLFGHSMGARVAFAVTRELSRQ